MTSKPVMDHWGNWAVMVFPLNSIQPLPQKLVTRLESGRSPCAGASSACGTALGDLCILTQLFCNHSRATIATSELTQQLHHLFHQQLFPTNPKRSCSPHGSGVCSVVEASREVAEALQSQRLMPLPQQGRRKGQTEAQHHGLVQTPQKPQFSGAGCCTVWKLHFYWLILYCSVV